jgi:hypothetical protein
MISQNSTDAKRQVIADQQWKTVQVEDTQNVELLDLSHQILELTKQVHAITAALPGITPPTQPRGVRPAELILGLRAQATFPHTLASWRPVASCEAALRPSGAGNWR